MYVFRLKTAVAALAVGRDEHMKIVTLRSGTVVRTRKSGPVLPKTGLVDVEADGEDLAMFMQDLRDRGEEVHERADKEHPCSEPSPPPLVPPTTS